MKSLKIILRMGLVLCLSISACVRSDEIESLEGRKISSLEIRHATPKFVPNRRLENIIQSKPGTIYSGERLDSDMVALWSSGYVEDVKFSVTKDGESLHLLAVISTRPGFGPLLITGNRTFPGHALSEEVDPANSARISRVISRELDPLTDQPIIRRDPKLVSEVLPAVREDLRKFYVKRGFKDVKIRIQSWKGGPPTDQDFLFVIDEGVKK